MSNRARSTKNGDEERVPTQNTRRVAGALGLNDKDRDIVSHELKKLKIRYRKIRGLKDEQSVFLRLAHVFANFL